MTTAYTETIRAATPAGHQGAVGFAMAQLFSEFPHLPTPHWSIPVPRLPDNRVLHGHLQGEHETVEAFQAYVKALGAEIQSTLPYVQYGQLVRAHYAKAEWKGISIEVLVVLSAEAAVTEAE